MFMYIVSARDHRGGVALHGARVSYQPLNITAGNIILFFFFFTKVSLTTQQFGGGGFHIAQVVFEPPVPTFQVLKLQACATMPGSFTSCT